MCPLWWGEGEDGMGCVIRYCGGAVLLGALWVFCTAAGAQDVRFVDVTEQCGIDFVHVNGASQEKFPVETMCAGCGFLDYDGDGDLDIYLVNGAPLPGFKAEQTPVNRLYRNDGAASGWTFTDVTEASGAGDSGYGMGCVAGDYDNDGDQDLYVTNWGPNVLYRNEGNGTFTNVTDQAGVGNALWGSAAAFFDYDGDGDLDLYVANYLDSRLDNNKFCSSLRSMGKRAYCHPDEYPGVPDVLYRNEGDGTFTDVTREAGVYQPGGKGLGVVCTDYDGDGDLDLYVANDSMENYLFDNSGDGMFEEVALLVGAAFNEAGQAEAGMGVDCADVDGDGFLDLMIGHLDNETNTLYRNEGEGMFTDVTPTSGIGPPTLLKVTFGMVFLDVENDGDADAFAANGHVLDNISLVSDQVPYKQPNQLFENVGGGRFVEASERYGPGLGIVKASRGLAAGDYDNDGDVDLLVANIAEGPDLLRNEGGNGENWLMVKLVGGARGGMRDAGFGNKGIPSRQERRSGEPEAGLPVRCTQTGVSQSSGVGGEGSGGGVSNRDGVGARVTVVAGDLRQVKEVHCGASYLAANDLRVHFGLGKREGVDSLEVRWPSGIVDRVEGVGVNRLVVIREGEAGRGWGR